MGKELARFADQAERQWADELALVPVRCKSCAFRAGTVPNGCESTTLDALKCIVEGVPFLCHQELEGYGEGALCAGYLMLVGAGDGPTMQWPFSE